MDGLSRPIHLVRIDKTRPAVILTREAAVGVRPHVTVVGITTRIRGLDVEVPVGTSNGVDPASVINCDDVHTLRADRIGRQIGFLQASQEPALARALVNAFDLAIEELEP